MRELEIWTINRSASLEVLRTRRRVTIEQQYLRTKRFAYITSTPIFDDYGNITMIVSNNRDFKKIDQLKEKLAAVQHLVNQYEEKIRAITYQMVSMDKVIFQDKVMYPVMYMAVKAAQTDSTVLLLGETGTGKEVFAKFIHQNSPRGNKTFVIVNCGAISRDLIESELFGYIKGAFTGASSSGKIGFFEVADNGTLFLDEIGELPLEAQAKLLRTLQEGEIIRVGDTQPIRVNVRLIAATNRKLLDMVNKGQFRADLYYRLNVVQIEIPPLRERKDDITVLANHFLKRYNEKFLSAKTLNQSAYNLLKHYSWPGNIRELKNAIEQVVIMSDEDVITAADFNINRQIMADNESNGSVIDLNRILEETEYRYIKKYYNELGTLKLTANKLGINIKTLSRRKKYLEEKFNGEKL